MVVLVKACLVIIQRQSMSSWVKCQWLYRYRKRMSGYQWGDRRVKGNIGVGQKKHKGLLWNYMKSWVWNFWKLLSTLQFNLSFNKINHIILQIKRMPLFRFRKCLVNLPLFQCNSIHSHHDPPPAWGCAWSGWTDGGGTRLIGWSQPVTCVSVCLVTHLSKRGTPNAFHGQGRGTNEWS